MLYSAWICGVGGVKVSDWELVRITNAIFNKTTNLFEVIQEALEVPSLVPQGLPRIVIRLRAAIKDHTIELRRAAHNFTQRNRNDATLQLGIGGVRDIPIVFGAYGATSKAWYSDKRLVLVTNAWISMCMI